VLAINWQRQECAGQSVDHDVWGTAYLIVDTDAPARK